MVWKTMQKCCAISPRTRKLPAPMSRSPKTCRGIPGGCPAPMSLTQPVSDNYEMLRREIMSNVPIADYALVSDCRSAALVNRAGSVDWLCFPRFDGPSVFARLLDEQAGHWSIYPVNATEV